MDLVAFLLRVQSHPWSRRRTLIVDVLMRHAPEIDKMEYGKITFNLGPETITPEINRVLPKERVDQ
jgi:hypothetical protein